MLFLPHVFLQVGIKQVIRCFMHTPVNITGIKRETQNLCTGNRIYRYIITGNDRTGGLTRESRTLPNVLLSRVKLRSGYIR